MDEGETEEGLIGDGGECLLVLASTLRGGREGGRVRREGLIGDGGECLLVLASTLKGGREGGRVRKEGLIGGSRERLPVLASTLKGGREGGREGRTESTMSWREPPSMYSTIKATVASSMQAKAS